MERFGWDARVVVVDDDPLFKEVLDAILGGDERYWIVGMAANGRDGVELVRALRPDIVLMDIEMPVLNGIEATRILANTAPRVCVVAVSGSPERAQESRAAGAAAFVPKHLVAVELEDVLESVLSGRYELAATA